MGNVSKNSNQRVSDARRSGFSRGVSSVLTAGQSSKRYRGRRNGNPSKDMGKLAKDAKKTFRGFGDA